MIPTTLLLVVVTALTPPSVTPVQAARMTMQQKNQQGRQQYSLRVKWPLHKVESTPTSIDVADYTELCDFDRGLFLSVNKQVRFPSFECIVMISANRLSCIYEDDMGLTYFKGTKRFVARPI